MDDQIGIKLAKDLESIEDERVVFNARIAASQHKIEDYTAIIYYLASKLFNKQVKTVNAVYHTEFENSFSVQKIDPPRKIDNSLKNVEVNFEV
jgi:hypothetical protein